MTFAFWTRVLRSAVFVLGSTDRRDGCQIAETVALYAVATSPTVIVGSPAGCSNRCLGGTARVTSPRKQGGVQGAGARGWAHFPGIVFAEVPTFHR